MPLPGAVPYLKGNRLLVTNLAPLRTSRARPRPGDVFVMRPKGGFYLFGRVIATDVTIDEILTGCILIYVYRTRAQDKTPVPRLSPGDLLAPPMITNALPWRRGYFETVERGILPGAELLPRHCFWDGLARRHVDDTGEAVAPPSAGEPVGEWALQSYRTIDDEISRALGLPLAQG